MRYYIIEKSCNKGKLKNKFSIEVTTQFCVRNKDVLSILQILLSEARLKANLDNIIRLTAKPRHSEKRQTYIN